MAMELSVLAWAVVLGLVHVIVAAQFFTAANGLGYGTGPRDTPAKAPSVVGGRAGRAAKNFAETFPFFAAAILVAAASNRFDGFTAWGAQLYIWARVAYLPLYLAGVPTVRSLAWGVSVLGILLILAGLVSA